MSEITLLGPDKYILPIHFRGLYSDNTPYIKMPELDVQAVDTMVYRHSDTLGFVTAMFLVDSIFFRGGQIKKLIIAYVPGARQDRINPTGDILFSAEGFADMINHRQFSRVVILDPHSKVISNLIHNSVQYPLELIADVMAEKSDYTGVISPDEGAGPRARRFADVFQVPIYYATKHRDVSTGQLSGFSIDGLPRGNYLVVDDICDGGGTFVGLGEKISEQGSIADLYVTHGIFSKGTRKLRELYKNIYTTDSLFQENENRAITLPILERMINYDTNA